MNLTELVEELESVQQQLETLRQRERELVTILGLPDELLHISDELDTLALLHHGSAKSKSGVAVHQRLTKLKAVADDVTLPVVERLTRRLLVEVFLLDPKTP